MPKWKDYTITSEVVDIMESILERFEEVFEGFDTKKVATVCTLTKKKKGNPIRLLPIAYPYDVFIHNKTYIVEVFEERWRELTQKQKNLAVFHIMCAIPLGGFDEASNKYAKRKRPDYHMYAEEFAVCGGVPDWLTNPAAQDPVDDEDEEVARTPVTRTAIEEVETVSIST